MSHLCVEFHFQFATSSSFSTLVLTYQIECFNLVTYLRSRMSRPKLVEIKVVESQEAQTTKIGRTFTLFTLRRLGASVCGATLNVLH